MMRLVLLLLVTLSLWSTSTVSAQAPAQAPVHYFSSFDKTRIAYTDEGAGTPVLLIHGFISSGTSWNKSALKQKLIAQGFRVITPDLRGNGRSDQPTAAEAYKNDAEVKDLSMLIKHLKLTTLYAVGYSRGSIVLAKLLTHESNIKKAVFGGMGIDFTNPNWDRRIAFADAFSGREKPTALTAGAVEYASSIAAKLQILGLLQDYQPVTSIAALQKLSLKTLIIAGDEDTDNGDPALLAQAIPKSTLKIVKGDHNNTYKQDNFAEAVLSFLKTP